MLPDACRELADGSELLGVRQRPLDRDRASEVITRRSRSGSVRPAT